jgi:hypothetical protein
MSFERVYCDYEAMKASLVHESAVDNGTITLGEFYKGALIGKAVRDISLQFTTSNQVVNTLAARFPDTLFDPQVEEISSSKCSIDQQG